MDLAGPLGSRGVRLASRTEAAQARHSGNRRHRFLSGRWFTPHNAKDMKILKSDLRVLRVFVLFPYRPAASRRRGRLRLLRSLEHQFPGRRGVDDDVVALAELALQQAHGELVLDAALDR